MNQSPYTRFGGEAARRWKRMVPGGILSCVYPSIAASMRRRISSNLASSVIFWPDWSVT
jgi:hypothetical protein